MLMFAASVVGLIVYALLPKPIDVDMAAVTEGRLRVTVDEDGRTRIKQRYVVSVPLAGRMQRIDLRAGDPVEAGKTLLTTIEPTDPDLLDDRALAEAKARVKAAEVAVAKAQPDVEAAKAEMEYAESQLARFHKLEARDAVSDQEVEQAELRYRTSAEQYRSSQFARDIAQYELEVARASLLRTLPKETADPDAVEQDPPSRELEIRAPISGRVLRVFEENAKVVAPGTRLLELGDPRNLEVEIDVLSSDAVKIRPGAKALLEQWGGGAPLEGVVRVVEPAGFTKISALGVEEQRVWVIVDFTAPPETWRALGDAYRVEARIVVWESDHVVKVPTSALFRQGDQWAVFCYEDGRAHLRKIKIGRRNGLEAQVLEGLSADTRVIVHPSDKIADGVLVRPRPRG